MGSYQKADGITLSQLNNTEYTNFMNRVLTLLTAGSISKLTVTNIVNSIKPKLVQMEDLVNRSTANAETKDLLKLDAERDSYVSYLLATVRAAKNSPLAAQRDAYNTLEITVRPYTGLARMRNMEETAAIIGVDTLGYLPDGDLPVLVNREGQTCEQAGLCHACFCGHYPTAVPEHTEKDRFEAKLSDKPAKPRSRNRE